MHKQVGGLVATACTRDPGVAKVKSPVTQLYSEDPRTGTMPVTPSRSPESDTCAAGGTRTTPGGPWQPFPMVGFLGEDGDSATHNDVPVSGGTRVQQPVTPCPR